MNQTHYSTAFIVPFLNCASWADAFITHYAELLMTNSKSLVVLVEGATSFNSPAEHKGGFSVDGSEDLIRKHSSFNKRIMYVRRGRVHNSSELVTAGFTHADTVDSFCVISIHDFIDEGCLHILDEHIEDNTVIEFPKLFLKGTMRQSCRDDVLSGVKFYRNIEGMIFVDGIHEPHINERNVLVDAQGSNKGFSFARIGSSVISTQLIESEHQRTRRLMTEGKYLQWYYHNINSEAVRVDKPEEYATSRSSKINSFHSADIEVDIPEPLLNHPWFSLSETDIWSNPFPFPSANNKSADPMVYKDIQKLSRKRGKILEIGSAAGNLIKHLRMLGWQVQGVEPSKWASGYSRHIEGMITHTGVLEDVYENVDTDFDAIIMYDTIEHFTKPIDTLKLVRNLLDEDGVLILYTPDYRKIADDKVHYLWAPGQHYFLYDENSIRRLLSKAGMVVEYVDTEWDDKGMFIAATKA